MIQENLKNLIAGQIRSMTGSAKPVVAFLEPAGDPGLFGPNSVTWKVHAHFISMLVGGLSSLLVQATHPGALAGVWDHSNFRTDLRARLGRTAYFIAATTYGGKTMAQSAIDHVNRIHQRIQGTRLDGQSYSALDPHLLKWVHLGEVTSFLQAYMTHADPVLPLYAQDRYIHEMAQIGEALGAKDLPHTVQEAHTMLLAYRSELKIDDRVREIVCLIEQFPARWQDRALVRLVVAAAFEALPPWIAEDLGIKKQHPAAKALTRHALALASIPLEWTLATEGVRAYALRRVEATAQQHADPHPDPHKNQNQK